jgi:hydrogenase maturation factor
MVVESVDETTWLARCHETADAGEPAVAVDVELVGPVAIGDVVLVHAGVALALLAKAAPA